MLSPAYAPNTGSSVSPLPGSTSDKDKLPTGSPTPTQGSTMPLGSSTMVRRLRPTTSTASQTETPDTQAAKMPTALEVKGQGTVALILKEQVPFRIALKTGEGEQSRGFSVKVSKESVSFYKENGKTSEKLGEQKHDIGIDPDPACTYWFSLDSHNKTLRYGKGEVCKGATLHEYALSDNELAEVGKVGQIQYQGEIASSRVGRFPVVANPPMLILPSDEMDMAIIAEGNTATPENLSQAGRELYSMVGGKKLSLNTPDFPDFAKAIQHSILSKDGWCHRKLIEKAGGFGDAKTTYLRITLGENQGNSPGHPYVLEIWPAGHRSPIHDHGNATAIIRVLSGEIQANLYSMLSIHHQKPYATTMLEEGHVTYMSADCRQVHKLENLNQEGVPCVTLQCYQYEGTDNVHTEHFSYITHDGKEIHQFKPNSDMDFFEFKALMQTEWKNRESTVKNTPATITELSNAVHDAATVA